jgi:hypothetical protein
MDPIYVITPFQVWLYNWGPVVFLAAVIAWRLLLAGLGWLDHRRAKRGFE